MNTSLNSVLQRDRHSLVLSKWMEMQYGGGSSVQQEQMTWRPTTLSDINAISGLVNDDGISNIFGTESILEVIKTMCVGYTMEIDTNKEIVGFIAFRNYPTIMQIAPDAWEMWVDMMYDMPGVNAVNSFFVSYVTWDKRFSPEIFMKAVETAFEENIYLENVLFYAPRYRDLGEIRTMFLKYFTIQSQINEDSDPYMNVLYSIERSSVLPSVVVRVVTQEEHEKIHKLLSPLEPSSLHKSFGDFDLHEIMTQNRVMVMEEDKSTSVITMINGLNNISEPYLEIFRYNGINPFKSRETNDEFETDINMFKLELFVVLSDTKMIRELLIAVFNEFPCKRYCFIEVVNSSTNDKNQKILKYFTKLAVMDSLSVQKTPEIYILDRFSFLSEISVKLATKDDINQITEFIKPLPPTVQNNFLQDNIASVYLLLCGNNETIVGVASCVTLEDINGIKKLFHLEDENYDLMNFYDENSRFHRSYIDRPEFYCLLRHLYISTGFHQLLQVFVREISRHTGYLSFYMKVTEDTIPSNCLREFRFVKPKSDECPLFDLYMLSIRDSGAKKVEDDSRIVIFGNDIDLIITFVENLLYRENSPTNYFPNLYVITKNMQEINSRHVQQFNLKINYRNRLFHNIKAWVNFVEAKKVVKINRHERMILLSNGNQIPFDYLYILSNKVYALPRNMMKECKSNRLVLINSISDCLEFYKRIEYEDLSNGKIIVYGNDLQTLSALAYIIDLIPDGQIIFITPDMIDKLSQTPESVSRSMAFHFRNNSHVLEFHEKCELFDIHEENDQINASLILEMDECDHNLVFVVQCKYFLFFGRTAIDPDLVKLIYDAKILFNGGIVIDSEFRTNDPNVYALGSCTTFSRRVRGQVASTDFVALAARQLLTRLSIETSKEIPTIQPNIISCRFPFNFHYISYVSPFVSHIGQNTAIIDDNLVEWYEDNCCNFPSNKPISIIVRNEYLHLHGNDFGRIDAIYSLTRDMKPNINKLVKLYDTYMTLFGDIEDNFRNLRDTALYRREEGNCIPLKSLWIDIIFTDDFITARQMIYNEIDRTRHQSSNNKSEFYSHMNAFVKQIVHQLFQLHTHTITSQ